MAQGAVTFLYTGYANSVQKQRTLWHSKVICAMAWPLHSVLKRVFYNWRAPEMNRTSGYIPFFRPSLNSDVFSVYYSLSKLRERVLCMRKVDFSRTEQVFLYGKYTERIFILCSLLLSVHEVLDYVCPSILACWAKISGARTEQLIIFPGFLPR